MIKLRKEIYRKDFGPISKGCTCYTCTNYSRSYIQMQLKDKGDSSAIQLISLHNVHFLIHLMRGLRESILNDTVQDYARNFFVNYFSPEGEDSENAAEIPEWVINACKECNIDLKLD
jgi:queuine tRNA-ribosyltransferase